MYDDFLTREDLFERVTLPLGNIAHVLAAIVDGQEGIHPVALKAGLHQVLATVEDAHHFLQGLTQTTEERRQPRTPEQLREFVAEKAAEADRKFVELPVRSLNDVLAEYLAAKRG